MLSPVISVIVPAYHVENYVQRCLDALLNQSFQHFEVLLVVDQSADETESFCRGYAQKDARIKFLMGKGKGIACARNMALDVAVGQYIIFVDADDYLELNALELLHARAVESKADLVLCDYNAIYTTKAIPVYRKVIDRVCYLNKILEWSAIECALWAKIFKRELFESNNIRFVENMNYGEDYSVLPRLVYQAGKVEKLDAFLYNYERSNVQAATATKMTEKKATDLIAINLMISDYIEGMADGKLYVESLMLGKLNIRKALNGYSEQIHQLGDLKAYYALLPVADRLFYRFQDLGWYVMALNYNRLLRLFREGFAAFKRS